jgi:phosphomevalonate kinase
MNCAEDGNRIIIAISGKQLSGKDRLATLLLEKLSGFTRVGLGDAIKMELAKRKKISYEELEQNKHLYRPELIELGNKGRRLEKGLYWVNKVLATPGNLVVPDMRVEKEFNAFKNKGAIMVRVDARRDIRESRGQLVKEDDPTECGLDHISDWDFIIHNNEDLTMLEKQATDLCKTVLNKIKTRV